MLDFTQIQHYNRHGKRKTYGLRQFRFHFSKVAFAFCKAELSFNLYPFILVNKKWVCRLSRCSSLLGLPNAGPLSRIPCSLQK